MRVLVTGSRHLENYLVVYRALLKVTTDYELNYVPDEHGNTLPDPDKITVVVGDCKTGADLFAREWTYGNLMVPEVHEAKWATTVPRKKAGPDRNKEMAYSGIDLALAFPLGESRGTANCVMHCHAAGVPVRTYHEDGTYTDGPGVPSKPSESRTAS